MRLKILLFGITRDIAGASKMTVEVEPGASVKDLRRKLIREFPPLEELKSLALAVNNEYAKDGKSLSEDDEIALIPPVSGG